MAAILYLLCSAIYQREVHQTSGFRSAVQVVSWLSIAAVILPACCYLGGIVELEQVKGIMLVATPVWFLATPLWMGLRNSR